ncbi:MAG TPA: PDC sensor domain-containing protein [Gammaproteobacteria bacterium]
MSNLSGTSLQESVRLQREALTGLLGEALHQLAQRCAEVIQDRMLLEALLADTLPRLSNCKHLYVLNADGVQLTDNITLEGHDHEKYGSHRMDRPYMQGIIGITDFKLSDAYISRNRKRPSLTAVQVIRDDEGNRIGFVGADYDLRELPHTGQLYHEPEVWRQLKGDPAIRSSIFLHQRAESLMDRRMEAVLAIMHELILERGVYHGKLHFSSSRGTIWHVDDPFVYRILNIEQLTDPDICLAYPLRPYHPRAIVPREQVMPVFEMFRSLRFADDNIYLRAGSLNIINGMVGLNFSCDGSHYMRYDEFLDKNTDFWFGVAR